jgi:hypothetical protein
VLIWARRAAIPFVYYMASKIIPAELQQLIIDKAVVTATFAEIVSLAQVNEFWQMCLSRALPTWLDQQPEGQCLTPFGGSRIELQYLCEVVPRKCEQRTEVVIELIIGQ